MLAIVTQHVVQRRQGGHVQQRHGADIDNHHLDVVIEAAQHAQGFLRRAEEQRPANGVHQHVLGQILEGLMEVPGQGGGVGEVAHALDKQAGSQQQADTDGQHHVEQHGQDQAGQQHQHVTARGDAQGVQHMAGLTHVPRHHQQQGRQGRHR